MKAKKIAAAVVIALTVFVGLGLYKANGLKSIQIVKTITIKGTKKEVFEMVKYLNNFPKWSPFLAEDPTQKYTVTGTDGTPGARYNWNGKKGEEVGYQEIKKIEEDTFIAMQCDIQKPFEAKPAFDYYFTETANGIEVKQDFKVTSSLGNAFFMWLFNAKAGMEKMNEQGLKLLKKAVEER